MRNGGHNSLARFRLMERVSASVPAIARLDTEIDRVLSEVHLPAQSLQGRTVAVTSGSRGVASLQEIVRGICTWLKSQGAHPFVFPAMGSHGGATATGQSAICEGYGVTEDFVGAPIRSSMETVSVGKTAEGFPVFMDRHAWEADAVVVMNRVKPHTTFNGKVESGLLKMMAVGMGKEDGAREFHASARKHGYEKVIRAVSAQVLASGKILCGLGVIENELHEVCALRAAPSEGMVALDEACLAEARRLVPRLPFSNLQLLITDEIGKNISGTGMDTKVVGRGVQMLPGEAPNIGLIYARDLTPESGGNALGVGLADFVHQKLRDKIDFEKMYVNGRTSMSHKLVQLPMVMPSDREALDFALASLSDPTPEEQRVARIQNTQNLTRIAVSERLASEVSGLPNWRVTEASSEVCFDGAGNFAAHF